MTLRLVIFDMDGTLIDSQAHILAAMSHAFSALDLPLPERRAILDIVGLSLPVAMSRLAPDLAGADHNRLVEAYKAAFGGLRETESSPAYPGAEALLARLSQDPACCLGIATGKSRRGLMHVLQTKGWGRYFTTIQVADDHPSKPNPSMIAACLRETGVAPDRTVMIGDTVYDMDMARAAGVRGLAVGWGYHSAQRLGGAVSTGFDDLEARIEAVLGRVGA